MKKEYSGLVAYSIHFDGASIITSSGNCVAMIQLEFDGNGKCISDEWAWQIEYVGDKG